MTPAERLREGWYLMSPRDVEIELRRLRSGVETEPSHAVPLEMRAALRYRDEGNLPDELDRSLRLVLYVESAADLLALDRKRARFEPDHHEAPRWRRPGSRPVNVIPVRKHDIAPRSIGTWLDDEDVGAMERRWLVDGTVAGIRVPAEYRSFVYKTALALEASGRAVTISSITDSLERWLPPEDVERIRSALEAANG